VLIDTLAVSKVTSNEIETAVAEAVKTEKEIDATRELYRPVAFRGSILFFVIAQLNVVDPMYQYSLAWFNALFRAAFGAHPRPAMRLDLSGPLLESLGG
jgi:dynein heavy chain